MLEDWVVSEIREAVARRSRDEARHTAWGEPLVGFAAAADPLFNELKTAVRATHALPGDLLPGARSVVVYFLPFERSVARGNRHGYHASRQWADAYVETNQLVRDLNRHLIRGLEGRGFSCADLPPTHNFDTVELMSDWSHKHVAWIAGLGEFGRHHLLITEKGCCGRFGSLITTAVLEPSTRTEGEACLFKHDGSCGKCVEKCVIGALGDEGFDRQHCYALLLENEQLHAAAGKADVCGKCTAVVPCSYHDPVRLKKRRGAEAEKEG